MNRERAILGVLAIGFGVLVVETRFEHRDVVYESPVAWIPTIAAFVGMFACLFGMTQVNTSQLAARALLGLVAATGLVGSGLHSQLKPAAFARLFHISSLERSEAIEEFETTKEAGEKERKPPILAPLSLTGFGAIGFLVLVPTRPHRGGVWNIKSPA